MNRDLPAEPPIALVRGTEDRLPLDYARLGRLEATILDCCRRAGYDRLATPILERVELHERKSGAGIVGKLYQVQGTGPDRACLRPELTAGIVRAYTAADPAPALPWRVSHSGPTFRREGPGRPDRLREFHQVGVERLGDSGPYADAEVIGLACSALAEVGIGRPAIRVGHVGLILEILARSGLPSTVRTALIETLSAAAAEGGDAGSLGRGLDHFEGWLGQAGAVDEAPALPGAADVGIDRLFRTLVPVVTGRRSGGEVVARLRRKWDLGRDLLAKLDEVRSQVRALAGLKGAPTAVLDRLARDFEAWAPDSVASLRTLFRSLADHGVATEGIILDLGLGRGIGFYSQMIFDLTAETPAGTVELGGGGRYDGLARAFGSDRDDRGAGFAFGLERIDQVLRAQGNSQQAAGQDRPRAFLVIPATEAATSLAVGVAARIRAEGGRAILESGWVGASLADRARALAARWSVVVPPPGRAGRGLTLHDHDRGIEVDHDAGDLPRLVADLIGEAAR